MSGKRAIGKTIGEVERITGIPKRELKYYTEQGLVQPSQKSESGYWLYSREDILKVQLAALCREPDFPARKLSGYPGRPSPLLMLAIPTLR